MTPVFLSACILSLSATVAMFPAAAIEPTTINILSPHNGATVGNTFTITYEILNGPKDHHAHVYLDGTYLKGFKGTFTRVAKGEHSSRSRSPITTIKTQIPPRIPSR
jgi:hypothetical protein